MNNPTATTGDKNGKQYWIFGVRSSQAGKQLLTFATNGTMSSGYYNNFYSAFDGSYTQLQSGSSRAVVSNPEDVVTITMTIKNEEGSYVVNQKVEIEGVDTEYKSLTVPELQYWSVGGKSVYPMYIGSSHSSYNNYFGDPRIYSFEYEEGGSVTKRYEAKILSYDEVEICRGLAYNDGETGYFQKFLR